MASRLAFWLLALSLWSLNFAETVGQAQEVSCECPKLECDTCHDEQGVTFYSEKCGFKNSKVKSCARPTCVPVDPLPKQCEYVKKGGTDGVVIAGTQTPAPPVAPNENKEVAKTAPAVELVEARGAEVATAKIVKGKVWQQLPDGQKLELKENARVHEKDIILTEKDSEAQIAFDDGNISNVQANSKLKIQQYDKSDKKDGKAILDLLSGKIRTQVNKKYDGKNSYFQVKTKAAVAGVRGTDFVVTYQVIDQQKIETKVETLEGRVVLASKDDTEKVEIGAGEGSSFLVAANEGEIFDEDEITDFVARGYMTPVYKMSEADLKKLDKDTGFGLNGRNVAAAKEKPVCNSPKGEFNQCVWSCVNNPKGESKCRTDLPQVNCVRKRCDAEGQWSDEQRLPASFHDSCKPDGDRVGPCDY